MFGAPHFTFLARGILKEYDASGPQHLARISGLKGEELAKVTRLQQWGQTGNPPLGSHVLFARLGGAGDRAVLLGIDHADYSPKDLKAGQKAIYDSSGNIVKLTGSTMRVGAHGDLTIDAGTSITLKVGGVSVKITSAGIVVSGGTITHDGHAIDKTHVHVNAGGSGNSGPPA